MFSNLHLNWINSLQIFKESPCDHCKLVFLLLTRQWHRSASVWFLCSSSGYRRRCISLALPNSYKIHKGIWILNLCYFGFERRRINNSSRTALYPSPSKSCLPWNQSVSRSSCSNSFVLIFCSFFSKIFKSFLIKILLFLIK